MPEALSQPDLAADPGGESEDSHLTGPTRPRDGWVSGEGRPELVLDAVPVSVRAPGHSFYGGVGVDAGLSPSLAVSVMSRSPSNSTGNQ